MIREDYKLTINVPESAFGTYDKIARVSYWWAKDFKGSAANCGDAFTIRFGETFVDFKIMEAVPGNRVVWHVADCNLPWLEDKTEWNGTDVIFDISVSHGETTITMTHSGLTPGIECLEVCKEGWDGYIGRSLKQFLTDGRGMPE